MTTDPDLLRAEAFEELGHVISRDAALLVEQWCRRAVAEQVGAPRVHHAVLRDGLIKLLRAMGQSLAESNSADTYKHHMLALEHGEQRWDAGWSLTEVVQDYLILRLVLLEHLEEALDRPLASREIMAVGLALDEAITASLGMYVTFRDEFTRRVERERAEHEQRTKAELRNWEQIFAHAGWGIALLEPQSFRLSAANPTLARLLGASVDGLLGQPLADLLAAPMRQDLASLLAQGAGEGHCQFETELQSTDGQPIPVLVAVSAIRGASGDIVHYAANFQDIIQRKQLEHSLLNQTHALAELDRRKDEFLATLAHELRNPLAPIMHALEMLRMPNVTPELSAESLGVAERQMLQLARLVDDLLDMARISQGKVMLRQQAVDVAQAIASAVDSARPSIDSQGHQLSVTVPAEPVLVEVDPARLEQMLTNLINNAVKYTEPGGRIEIEAQRVGNQAVIRVRDNGIGIDPAMLPRMFDLFAQSDTTPERSRGGLGIGLALVRRLAQMHGGQIEAASAGPGQGSEFILRLPAISNPSAVPSKTPDARQSVAPPKTAFRILLVDDNEDVATMLAMLLSRVGHDVHVVYDGPAALETAERLLPEVILLDIGLPGMNGYEVAERLRKHPQLRSTWLVAMTGYGQDDDVRRAQQAGFDHHLLKPVRLDAIQQALSRRRASS